MLCFIDSLWYYWTHVSVECYRLELYLNLHLISFALNWHKSPLCMFPDHHWKWFQTHIIPEHQLSQFCSTKKRKFTFIRFINLMTNRHEGQKYHCKLEIMRLRCKIWQRVKRHKRHRIDCMKSPISIFSVFVRYQRFEIFICTIEYTHLQVLCACALCVCISIRW